MENDEENGHPDSCGIFLVEDHEAMQRILAKLIRQQAGLALCGTAGSAEEALRRIPAAQPDLVLVDISLPQQNGLELVQQLAVERPTLRTLVLSGQTKDVFAQEALRRGARGFVTKGNVNNLLRAIETVMAGGTYLPDR